MCVRVLMKYEVMLCKNPSIGLGITGGKDGENALHPGDKVCVPVNFVSHWHVCCKHKL